MLRLISLKLLSIISLVFFAMSAVADENTQQSHVQALKQDRKWEADEVLRQGMNSIRQVMVASRDDIEKERLNAQDYERLAEVVEKNTAAIVKNCKLSKEADKAFHTIILADLTGSAQMMRSSPKTQVKRAGALGVFQALRNYGMYFQHVGWSIETSDK